MKFQLLMTSLVCENQENIAVAAAVLKITSFVQQK